MKHTPTPWTPYDSVVRAGGRFICRVKHYTIPGEDDDDRCVEEDAKFICRAVNSHDALLEACKKTANAIRHGEGREVDFSFGQALSYCLTLLDAAIAQAEPPETEEK